MIGSHDFDFSFSGLKTAFANATKENFPVLRTSSDKVGWKQIILEQINESQKQILYDLCASLQDSITDVLVKKTLAAAEKFHTSSIIFGGGVSANQILRDKFQKELSTKHSGLNAKLFFPPKPLCVDNAAMIAAAAVFQGNETPWENVTADPELYFD